MKKLYGVFNYYGDDPYEVSKTIVNVCDCKETALIIKARLVAASPDSEPNCCGGYGVNEYVVEELSFDKITTAEDL